MVMLIDDNVLVLDIPMDEAEKAMFAKSVESVQGLIQACKDIDGSLA